MHLNELAKLLKITGDESRLKILCVIFDKNKICVSDIASDVNMSIATVSHHLQVMSKENLITPLRDGKKICYQLVKNSFVNDLKKFVCKYK
jgi:ArsR family transcriptional regulator